MLPMSRSLLWRPFLVVALLFVSFSPEIGETRPFLQEFLLKKVEERARRDAEAERPRQGTQDLHLLFAEEARGTGLSFGEVVSHYEETYFRSKPLKPWWDPLRPSAGWLAAAAMFLLFAFKESMQKGIEQIFGWLKEQVYTRFAGSRLFRRKALRCYRQALRAKYREIIMPFRPDRPLQMRDVYVPLKAKGASHADLIEAQQALSLHRRLMVVGPPGSGKSMLLKHLALGYAEGRMDNLPAFSCPILLELSRLNEGDKPIVDHLVEIFRLNDFPNAEQFVRLGLGRGNLVLLLDGLDEVNSSRREAAVEKVKNLLDEFDRCRCLITCRNAVYRDDFADIVDQTLEIIEFNDHQVQRFLDSWHRFLPPEKSIAQLISTLRDRPQIMALARNPLLLTIIAFLYTDTDFILPHSRAEFYDQAIDVLLLQWKGKKTRFSAPEKHLVLRHLALFNQTSGSQDQRDRRSIDFASVIREVKQVLPDLNRPDEEAQPILQEIVERSGLLLAIDGGARYQFAHLTLQEFFAASALNSEASRLLELFLLDRDAWRETVKLWCGLEHDSSALVTQVFAKDPITAFECLADARLINPTVVENIIDSFKPLLSASGEEGEAIGRAFAAVASDARPRGQFVFDFLHESLLSSDPVLRSAAAAALSLTNLPKAARVLASTYPQDEVRAGLVRMGDLSVPHLTHYARSGLLEAIDDLHLIGTPQAALALAQLIWGAGNPAVIAALRLSSLLSLANEDALRHIALTDAQLRVATYTWVWAPFQEPENSALPHVAGRIVYLLTDAASQDLAPVNIDERLLVPFAVHVRRQYGGLRYLGAENVPWSDELVRLLGPLPQMRTIDKSMALDRFAARMRGEDDGKRSGSEFTEALLLTVGAKDLLWVLRCVEPAKRWPIFERLTGARIPTIQDWQNVWNPLKYEFESSSHYRAILTLNFGIALAALTAAFFSLGQKYISMPVTVTIGAIASILMAQYTVIRGSDKFGSRPFGPTGVLLAWLATLVLPIAISDEWGSFKKHIFQVEWELIATLAALAPAAPLTILFCVKATLLVLSPIQVAGTWGGFGAGVGLILWRGMVRQRQASNPLKGIFDLWEGGRRSLTSSLRSLLALR